ncbi:TIGR02594 family protein [Bradyrhizobium sp. AUGA SZCCT0283]|uniref:TIGR02594 family protein n=1 Tax=Bradyrhizobium sp. AUGA SZCCT0283 TaxID=2807671 RepID=UPI001BA57318|nr:TIGR02594 family protein [Bradyrhizobium sp. AUGA SZCCT0283]MBR1274414.1 TIGR02594 family protein [Bradyrhizobium sp. AUGA SZCCT0283]
MIKFVDLAAEYKSLWDTAAIRPERLKEVKAVAKTLRGLKPTYDEVSAATTVPWFIVGLIHSLEATFDMEAHLHNGDPLTARTVQVPSGRPKNGSPTFSWAASAIDALTMHGMQNIGKDGWSIERISFELERYNGFGYRRNHPTVKSPYLWSCTNHYTSGKYVGDHKFSMTAVSAQVGAMAVLKQLVADGVVKLGVQADLPAPKPPERPPAVPVPTGLFLADKQPFGLRAEPKDDAERLLRVETDMAVRKLEQLDAPWWKVEVMAPDTSTHVGFARQDWLTPQTVLSRFVPEEFAQACLDVAARYGTNAHLLIALADAETALTNNASPNGLYFGPYAISESEWKAVNVPAETGFGDEGRFDPLARAAIAARFIVQLTQEAREKLPDRRLPSAEELCLARIFGSEVLPALLADANQTRTVREVLAPMSAADIDAIFARRPGLLTTGITVKDLRAAIDARLSTGFEDAAGLIGKVDPDLSFGPPETADDVSDVPWMVKAKEELAKKIHEFENGSNPEIEKYFVDTTLGRQPDDVSWCAAFVSWCIKESNGARSPVTFSARAADWLKNGKGLEGPQYGAVAVTRPLARGASGHVGFVIAWDGTHVTLLGGNQGNAVCARNFPIDVVRGWRMV